MPRSWQYRVTLWPLRFCPCISLDHDFSFIPSLLHFFQALGLEIISRRAYSLFDRAKEWGLRGAYVGLAFLLEGPAQICMFLLMLVYGGLEASSWLAFAATNRFKITFLGAGPTEVRIVFIMVQTAIIFCGTAWLSAAMPYVLGVSCIALSWIAYNAQSELWQLDMKNKAEEKS